MDYYSTIKGNKLVIHMTTHMDLKDVMLSEKVTLKGHILYNYIK